MALSLSNFLFICAAAPVLPGLFAQAKNVTYDFNITWVNANPDGLFTRPVIGINGQWPIPEVRVTKGDRLITHVHNQLGNQSTSMHYHGMYHQFGSNEMDGPVGVTQCAIPAGKSMTYDFVVDQPGTYWYHSHDKGQYPDGFRGPMLVDDPDSPYKNMYDGEIVIRLSDWYHEQMPVLLQRFINVANPTGAEPVPDAALINDSQNVTVAVEPGKTYFVRIINTGAFAGQYFWFQGHTMRIIEVDGVYTEPAEAEMIYLTAAQRYGVLLTTKNETTANYPFMTSMDQTLFDVVPPTLNPNATGWLTYNEKADKPKPTFPAIFTPFNDYTLIPYDHRELLEPVDHQIVLDLKMDDLSNGANYAFFNDITYVAPRVPTLYSVLSSGQNASSAEIYGVNTNPHVLQYGEVVEIVLNNNDGGRHPFHLHGHAFQAVERPHAGSGSYNGTGTPSKLPMRRDTFMVMPNSHFVIRFRANNPGVWFFHCHIDWHLVTGLAATMIEAPLEIQQRVKIPEDHYQACYDLNQPTKGNAAGNTQDLFDLSGEPAPPAPLPAGFTAKGIVALVFSCLAAFIGMAVITWYGVAPLGTAEFAHAQHRIKDAGVS